MAYDPTKLLQQLENRLLSDSEYALRRERYGLDDSDSKCDRPGIEYMELYVRAVFAGIYPSPKALLRIAFGLNKFIAAKGDLTLEDAFELKSKQRIGNPSAQLARERFKNNYLFEMAAYRASRPNASLIEAAEYVRNLLEIRSPDCETMVNYYSDGNWREWEKYVPKTPGK